ncbi:MAG: EAL domain-containing protein, partial [Dokdonella sp.]
LSGVQVDNIDVLARSFHQLLNGRTYTVGDVQHTIGATVGAQLLSPRTVTADEALERAKAASAAGPHVPAAVSAARTPPVSESSERLRIALEQARFVILVQPVVALATRPFEQSGWQRGARGDGTLYAVRLRMVGKDGQLIQPRAFVPLAERVGMIQRIDLWVVNGVLSHLAGARDKDPSIGLIARLSPATLADPESLEAIEKAVVAIGVPASQLVLEIGASADLSNLPAARRFIARLQAIGCRFVLRGSGTGPGSLPFLGSQRLPGDFVRLDPALVQRMRGDERELKRVASIANLAQSLGMRVIAGDVDQLATLDAVLQAGVDYAQGSCIGEPKLLKRIDFSALIAPA